MHVSLRYSIVHELSLLEICWYKSDMKIYFIHASIGIDQIFLNWQTGIPKQNVKSIEHLHTLSYHSSFTMFRAK